MNGISHFQRRVYQALLEIPKGRVTTYKILGEHINCKSAQAIGQALRKNPFAPEVPCHRVITSDYAIGGYSGEVCGPQITKKLNLLKIEGIGFDKYNKLVDLNKIFKFN